MTNMNAGLPEITMVLALAASLTSLGIAMTQFLKTRMQMPTSNGAESNIAELIREGEDRLSTMFAMMEEAQQARFDALRSDISSIRAEIDWLTGEQMVEQAINMARNGVSVEEINAELGLSQEVAETLNATRVH
ncbi:hypothetical protein ACSBLW_11360 [Thioclava sp. FR2]|uniref:hypothetical protein n=1 Tax=Thioclava sp. FR2 TaxID=3445780 RepID=UPI003EC13D08